MTKAGMKIMALVLAGCLTTTLAPVSFASTTAPQTTAATAVYAASDSNVTYKAASTTYTTSNSTLVSFTNSAVTASGAYSGYEIDGTSITITESGTYVFSGTCTDGSIVVSKGLTDVTIVFDGLTLTSTTTAPFNAKSDTEVTIEVKAGSTNTLTDADRSEEKPKSCINSGGDLIIDGTGTLIVNGNNKNGIKADGNLTISEADITVKAADNGIAADNVLTVDSGSFDITAGGAGVKSSPDEITDDTQGKIVINGGTFDINSEGDAVHSDAYIYILGGDFTINAGDDGMHADTSLIIGEEGGADSSLSIDVQSSYEGLEGGCVYFYAGTVNVVSSDDGVNAAGGSSDTTVQPGAATGNTTGSTDTTTAKTTDDKFNAGGGFGGFKGGNFGGGMSNVGDYYIYIYGGDITVTAGGDGLDSNGSIYMYGGDVKVNQEGSGNSAVDYETSCEIYGGTLLGAGSTGMVATPTQADGTQPYVNFTVSSKIASGSTISVKNSSGTTIYTAAVTKAVNSVILSSEKLVDGDTYTLYVGSTSTATADATTVSTGNGMGGGGMHGGTRPDQTTSGGAIDGGGASGGFSFTDVANDAWYYQAVNFVNRSGLMSGVSDTEFSPNASMTRAMLVTVLWRMDGQTAAASSSTFSDVASGSWYSDAVDWAVENGIVTGYSSSTFAPEASVTREEIAVILQRYAKYKGTDVTGAADISTYTDVSGISSWASDAVKWAVNSGIISGKTETTIDPSGNATRAEVATMLMRSTSTLGGNSQMPVAPPDETRPEMPTDGTMPEMPTDGTMPEMPTDGTMPEMPTDGTMPEMPADGTAPQMPTDGTMPEMPADSTQTA